MWKLCNQVDQENAVHQLQFFCDVNEAQVYTQKSLHRCSLFVSIVMNYKIKQRG